MRRKPEFRSVPQFFQTNESFNSTQELDHTRWHDYNSQDTLG